MLMTLQSELERERINIITGEGAAFDLRRQSAPLNNVPRAP